MALDPAHLLLLSRFLSLQRTSEPWGGQSDEALGEPIGTAIERLRDNGLIEEIGAEEKLTHFHSAASLRSMLKSAGLPIGGSKNELARRFAEKRAGKAAKIVATIVAARSPRVAG